ncbi:MAG: hypothetical protein L7U87_02505 [Chlamydiales bacterium]|nr:hypothetical protein [Chlamydiales bacterium]
MDPSKKKLTQLKTSIKEEVQASNSQESSLLPRETSEEQYQQLLQKIKVRSEFIFKKIPPELVKAFTKAIYQYLRGNISGTSFRIWPNYLFLEGTQKLKYSLHLVIIAPRGQEAFSEAFLKLPFSLRGASLSHSGCASSFLASEEDIYAYFNDRPIKKALSLDLRMPIQRATQKQESLEFLQHQQADVRDDTIFLIFDNDQGIYTQYVYERYPSHPILSCINHASSLDRLDSIFDSCRMALPSVIKDKDIYKHALFLPSLSSYYTSESALRNWGYLFATIVAVSKIAPEYSSSAWGIEGGPEGILRVVQARYGKKSNYSSEEITHALRWASKNKPNRF